jgi:hypothetical protein
MSERKNKYDSSDCLERGDHTESLFEILAISNDWDVYEPTNRENIDQHWDFAIRRGNENYRVDVKSLKKISRSDEKVQDSWTWIELHGVRENDSGWLFAGRADLIAFERFDSFIFVKRTDLIALIVSLVDFSSISGSPENARYKVYRRINRFDKITLIESKYLESIKWDEWNKEKFSNSS